MKDVVISILVPLFNTPITFLREMIESVISQTYSKWELCLADGSDFEHRDVEEICREYMTKDSRVIYKKLKKNLYISENTNECIKMSTGDYIALFDHDDILHCEALSEVIKVIEKEKADFIYTDEIKFSKSIKDAYSPNYKPDFAPDELRSHNYICHLTVFRKELLNKTGLYASKYNGSQDHDMVLRLSEHAEKIVHIPKVLYYWRVHAGSVASNISAKSYAVEAGILSVTDHIKRLGLEGSVRNIEPYPSLYKIDYKIDHPSVNVIIYNTDSVEQTNNCIFSLDYHQNYRGIKLSVVTHSSNYEAMKKKLWNAPTVWPLEIIEYNDKTNMFNQINNIIKNQREEYVLFVSAATFIDTDSYIEELLMYAQRNDVGFVSGKISDRKHKIVDYGCALQESGSLKVLFANYNRFEQGFEAILKHPRNTSAVLGNFCMVNKSKLTDIGLLDFKMGNLAIADLCIKLRKKELLNVVIPFVECTYDNSNYEINQDIEFVKTYSHFYEHDPYYNPNIERFNIF